MKNFLFTILNIFFFLGFALSPIYILRAVGVDEAFERGETLIPCGASQLVGDIQTQKDIVQIENPCNAEHFIIMLNKIIEFVLIYLALPIVTIVLMFAGFKLITSGGDIHARSEAKSMLFNILKGLLFIAGSWLIVTTILTVLGYQGSTILK